ncbi:hypothetical protein GCM10017653_07090 [Ancylobacter defluvii]|uniref:Uncharacterized protein n=1 Tax=Ancylobacter defluvii TaxID=1282440 RepID=A0A9W6JV31_9HYPH|nr:hypothetical protein GCM10017653_07090 [Ancylobacter defluvii]
MAIDRRLARAEQVEVRSVDDVNGARLDGIGHGAPSDGPAGGSRHDRGVIGKGSPEAKPLTVSPGSGGPLARG